MIIGNNRIIKLLIGILIVLVLLTLCASVDYATNYTDNDTIIATSNQTFNLTNMTYTNGTYYVLPNDTGIAKVHNVVIEKPKYPTVTITARPSCGCGRHYSYRWRTRTFVDYCPHCHRYGVLRNVHKPQAKWEQELTCKRCGADYCGNCGHEKYSWSKYYIKKI